MKREVLVLGGGMVGVCTALHLLQRGHAVTLVDRREPGQETSYGNAGFIQREAVEPYAFPRDFASLRDALFKRGAAVSYHLAALPALAGPLSAYWRHSRPEQHALLARSHARLIALCLDEHRVFIQAAGAGDLVRQEGYRAVFRQPASWRSAAEEARRLGEDMGLRHAVLDGEALAAAEPALKRRLAGAVHWLDPWTVSDPGELVTRYAALLRERGAHVLHGDARTLRQAGGRWRVMTSTGEIEGSDAVLALGPWSDGVLRGLGYRYPLFVKRGYHRHYRGGAVPQLPMLDADGGLVLAPMAQGVRITTGAELAALDAPRTPVQLARAWRLANELFDLPQAVEDEPWMGARPCTADMLPVIGAAPQHAGLWFNFGHAHQGFTLGPVSGRLLAELMSGEPPVVPAEAYAPRRFG